MSLFAESQELIFDIPINGLINSSTDESLQIFSRLSNYTGATDPTAGATVVINASWVLLNGDGVTQYTYVSGLEATFTFSGNNATDVSTTADAGLTNIVVSHSVDDGEAFFSISTPWPRLEVRDTDQVRFTVNSVTVTPATTASFATGTAGTSNIRAQLGMPDVVYDAKPSDAAAYLTSDNTDIFAVTTQGGLGTHLNRQLLFVGSTSTPFISTPHSQVGDWVMVETQWDNATSSVFTAEVTYNIVYLPFSISGNGPLSGTTTSLGGTVEYYNNGSPGLVRNDSGIAIAAFEPRRVEVPSGSASSADEGVILRLNPYTPDDISNN